MKWWVAGKNYCKEKQILLSFNKGIECKFGGKRDFLLLILSAKGARKEKKQLSAQAYKIIRMILFESDSSEISASVAVVFLHGYFE